MTDSLFISCFVLSQVQIDHSLHACEWQLEAALGGWLDTFENKAEAFLFSVSPESSYPLSQLPGREGVWWGRGGPIPAGLWGQAVGSPSPNLPVLLLTLGRPLFRNVEVAGVRRALDLDKSSGEGLSVERKHPSWFTLFCLTPPGRCTGASLFGLETSCFTSVESCPLKKSPLKAKIRDHSKET